MTEVTKQEMLSLMYEFALTNSDYRNALRESPKKLLEKQMGRDLPETLEVTAVEERPNRLYLVVPWVPETGDELSDEDLEQVAGGKGGDSSGAGSADKSSSYICNDAKGIATRVQVATDVSLF